MKKLIKYILFLLPLFMFWSCEKDIAPYEEITPYDIADPDDNAGQWDPILLAKAGDIMVEAPKPTSSTEHQAELQELRQLTLNLTDDQKKAIRYWGANALVRWNEIARELVAKYNLAPASGADGAYPAPSQVNPGVYPLFPFANPPYASRAYAYWSAAQFDALISAAYYRKLYGRAAPYQSDAAIAVALPKSSSPSYPSDDAVIAAVSREILTFMFPLEAEYLKQKAEEHGSVRLWAGMNVRSDLAAGEALGKAVAAAFLNRAKTDGMKNALGNQAVWDSLANTAQVRFGWSWQSLEAPKRPPMLPVFGNVKSWCVPNIEGVRPPAPPALNSAEFQKAADELKQLSKNLSAEQRRIANFWADGVGTPTPPGHWNEIAAGLILRERMSPVRSARVLAYLNMALMDAAICCWDTKYFYHYPRPSQVIAGYRSLLGLPNFPSYTSGHSTFSAAAATVLGHMFPADAAEMDRMALEASLSRIYGGIHFRFDCEAGVQAGKAIGDLSLVVAQADGAE